MLAFAKKTISKKHREIVDSLKASATKCKFASLSNVVPLVEHLESLLGDDGRYIHLYRKKDSFKTFNEVHGMGFRKTTRKFMSPLKALKLADDGKEKNHFHCLNIVISEINGKVRYIFIIRFFVLFLINLHNNNYRYCIFSEDCTPLAFQSILEN